MVCLYKTSLLILHVVAGQLLFIIYSVSLHLTSEEKAISRCTRVLVEEHLFKLLAGQNYVSNCVSK